MWIAARRSGDECLRSQSPAAQRARFEREAVRHQLNRGPAGARSRRGLLLCGRRRWADGRAGSSGGGANHLPRTDRGVLEAGVDLLILETFYNLEELREALFAARELAPEELALVTQITVGAD